MLSSEMIARAVAIGLLSFGAGSLVMAALFSFSFQGRRPPVWLVFSMALVVVGASFTLGLLNQRRVPTPCEAVVVAATSACRAENAVLAGQLQQQEQRLRDVESIVWEVHTLPQMPSGNIDALCNSIGDHSVLRTDNQLHGYSVWTNGRGEVKLACRYLRPKEAP